MNGMPITMLEGIPTLRGFGCAACNLRGLGCPGCGGRCQQQQVMGMGALGVTLDEVKKFFIGPLRYVKNTKETPVYKAAGQAPYKTVAANNTIGKIVNINSKGNWGILENGDWILLSDTMYTVDLTTPPPTSVSDAIGREAQKITDYLPSKATLMFIGTVVAIVGVAVIVSKFKSNPPQTIKVTN